MNYLLQFNNKVFFIKRTIKVSKININDEKMQLSIITKYYDNACDDKVVSDNKSLIELKTQYLRVLMSYSFNAKLKRFINFLFNIENSFVLYNISII